MNQREMKTEPKYDRKVAALQFLALISSQWSLKGIYPLKKRQYILCKLTFH